MKAKELSDEKLAEFIHSIVDWHRTGVLNNEEFRVMAEANYTDNVFCFSMFELAILTEGAIRFATQKGPNA